jgi:hypothetical protein
VGPTCLRARERERVPFWEFGWVGHGPLAELGRIASPQPFLIFSFSFSFPFLVFPISFILFAKMLKINSNHYQKFSKKINAMI